MIDFHANWAMRLSERRANTFVGREAELTVLRAIINETPLPFHVLSITGAPGSGKTTLLRTFGAQCDAAGLPYAFVDARTMQPSTDSFFRHLRTALGLCEDQSIPGALAQHKRFALVIDNYDTLYPLHDWLCEMVFPELPASTVVVVASRKSPPELWRTDPAWRDLVKVINLTNLSPQEARTYLDLCSVPSSAHHRLITFSQGHPLALSLVVDNYHQSPDGVVDPGAAPDLMQTLVRRFVGDVTESSYRSTLEVCAMVRVTTEDVLAAILDQSDVRTEFDWLCGLSFIDFSSEGVYPHDLVREVILYDLQWRNPDRFRQMRRRALQYYTSRPEKPSPAGRSTPVESSPGQPSYTVVEEALEDYLFLHRDHDVLSPFLRQEGVEAILPKCEPASPSDHGQMLSLLQRWEGEQSARLLAHWLRCQPEGAWVVRDSLGNVAAFLFIARLDDIRKQHIGEDHIARAIWDHVKRSDFLEPGGLLTIARFAVQAHVYQDVSPELAAFTVTLLQHCLKLNNLQFSFTVVIHPERWEQLASSTGFFPRTNHLHFEVSGRPVGVFMQDWREERPEEWLSRLAPKELPELVSSRDREGPGKDKERKAAAEHAPEDQEALDRLNTEKDQFAQDIRHALKYLHVWDMLMSNRLIESKMVTAAAGPNADVNDRVRALKQALCDTIAFLKTMPAREKLYRALRYTYLEPQGSQEQTAEFLDLPFSTYRGHLRAGIQVLTELLWHQEADL